jgi:DNA-binding NarL/FixJ family response regulator
MVRVAVWTSARRPFNIPGVRSVLIVDDHRPFRSSARQLLEAEGFNVVGEAADGREAIAAAQRLEPDLILLDVHLPDLDGFEVAARIAALGLRSAVVLTSSRPMGQYGSLVSESPARGFIPKEELSGGRLAGLAPP